MMVYFLYFLFIWLNVYYLTRLNILNERFKNKEESNISIFDYVYYLIRSIYWVFLILSFFISDIFLLKMLFILGLIKFIIYHLNFRLYKIYSSLLPIISIVILTFLLLLL